MKRCEVLIPFHLIATDTIYKPGDIIEVSDAQLAKINAIDARMVKVLGDVKPVAVDSAAEKPKTTKNRKPKEQ